LLLLFPNAGDAVGYALAYHRALDELKPPLTVRVMSLAQPGQTLLTSEARNALGATPLRVHSHGHWRMKGIEAPIEVHEVGEAHAPFVPPPDSAKCHRVVRRNAAWRRNGPSTPPLGSVRREGVQPVFTMIGSV
jgi:hypothetical protein